MYTLHERYVVVKSNLTMYAIEPGNTYNWDIVRLALMQLSRFIIIFQSTLSESRFGPKVALPFSRDGKDSVLLIKTSPDDVGKYGLLRPGEVAIFDEVSGRGKLSPSRPTTALVPLDLSLLQKFCRILIP